MVTLADVKKVGALFIQHPDIYGVEVFGSVARSGVGNDADIIFEVSPTNETLYAHELGELLYQQLCGYHVEYADKIAAASKIFQDDLLFSVLHCDAVRAIPAIHCNMDIFLFAKGWRTRAEELQSVYHFHDPHFLNNIAKDAIQIA